MSIDKKEFRELVEAAMARDKAALEKLEGFLQKYPKEPIRGNMRTIRASIKAYEKILKQIDRLPFKNKT